MQVPLVERSHLCAPVRHGCDDGTNVGDIVSAFVGAGEGDVIGVFVSAVAVAMHWHLGRGNHAGELAFRHVMSAVRQLGGKSAEINASISRNLKYKISKILSAIIFTRPHARLSGGAAKS